MKYFTADPHVAHRNIIDYCQRPFLKADGQMDTDAMFWQLLDNFGSVLRAGDDLYILGDLSFNADQAVHFLERLRGRVGNVNFFMIWGNHDPEETKDRKILEKYFVKTADLYEVKLKNKTRAVLCHFPLLRWNRAHFGSYMLHGHTHGEITYPYPMRILDVGVDSTFSVGGFTHPKYFPVSEDEVIRYMEALPLVKHHYYEGEAR